MEGGWKGARMVSLRGLGFMGVYGYSYKVGKELTFQASRYSVFLVT